MLNFEDIYREHHPFVLRHCSRMVNGADDAEDLAQEVFVSVLRNLHKFDGRSKIFTWLYRIALNTFLMSRRKKRISTVFMASEPPVEFNVARDMSVREALSNLSDTDFTVLVRHYVNGETFLEIAAGEKVGTVKTRCHRAVHRFVEALND